MLKRKFIVFLLLGIIACEDNKEKHSRNFTPYQIAYQKADSIFGWYGGVHIIDTTSVEKEIIHKFIEEASKIDNLGMMAAVKFRTGEFEEAFDIYRQLYVNQQRHSGIQSDLEASLAGILLGAKFNYSEHSDLYYKSERIIEQVEYDNLTMTQKKYVDLYLNLFRDLNVFKTLITSPLTLENVIKNYELTEQELEKIYRENIDNDLGFSKLISFKLEEKYQIFNALKMMLNEFNESNFRGVKNFYDNNHSTFSDIKDKELKNLLNTILFYTCINLEEYDNVLKYYIEIEKHYQYLRHEIYEKETIEIESLDKFFNTNSEINNVRIAIRYQIQLNNITEDDIINTMPNINNIKVIFNEMLFLKSLWNLNYDKAFNQYSIMREQLLFDEIIPRNIFLKFKKLIDIVHFSDDQEILLELKTSYEIDLQNSIYSTIDYYYLKDDFVTENREQLKSNIEDIINSTIHNDSKKYSNIFQIIEDDKKYFIEGAEQVLNDLAMFDGNKEFFIWHYIRILKDRMIRDTEENLLSNFLKYYDHLSYSQLHYNLILYNLILENLNYNYSKDFSYYYLTTFFSDLIYFKLSDSYKANEKFVSNNCERVNDLAILQNDRNFSSLQVKYYSDLKYKMLNIYQCD